MFQWTQVFQVGSTVEDSDNESDIYNRFTNLKSFGSVGSPGPPPSTTHLPGEDFLGLALPVFSQSFQRLTSQELCKNVRWLYGKQSQMDETINSGTLGKLGSTSIYLCNSPLIQTEAPWTRPLHSGVQLV